MILEEHYATAHYYPLFPNNSIQQSREPLEETLRRVVREELERVER
jgi:hypothetical protein